MGSDESTEGTDGRLQATRRTVLRGTAAAAGAATVGGGIGGLAGSAAARGRSTKRRFRVRIENVSTPDTLSTSEGSKPVPLSPGAYAVHDAEGPLFTPGEPASEGIEDVAEDGRPGTLASEAASADGVSEAGPFALEQTGEDPNQPDGGPEPPIFPGGAYEFTVEAGEDDRLSLASMFIQSNDLFYAPGPEGIPLFEDGAPVEGDVTDRIALWDASTEIDQEPGTGPDQAPRQGGLDTGAADDNSSTVRRVDEVNAEGYDYPDVSEVIRVTVTPVETRPFRVRVENVSTPDTLETPEGSVAVPLSPGAYAVHGASAPLFAPGEAASEGIEDVAEDGRPGTLAGEAAERPYVRDAGAFAGAEAVADPNQPDGAPEPPIFPGGAYEFTVSAAPGDRLSLATMFIQSNDLFYAPGPDGIALFEDGDPVAGEVTDGIALWDASTEIDQQPGTGPDQAPRQGGLDTGAADDNSSTVRRVAEVNAEGYDYPDVSDVIRVTVTPVDPTPFQVRIENATDRGFYPDDASTGGDVWLTPGAYATHVGENPILTEGAAASEGLEAIAEAGRPGGTPENRGLVAELAGAGNVTSSGAFTPADTVADPNDPTGSVPGAPPIAPGGAFEFTVTAVPGEKFSFASMFVPSNDLFFAPGDGGIDLFEDGDPVSGDVSDRVELFDAGTEPNGRPGFGSDQAPAQSSPDQGGDEGGVVRPINEVDDGYSYPAAGDAIRVTVEPSPASRSLDRSAVAAGGSVEVTLSVDLESAHDRVALVDTFDGPVDGATVASVTADGSTVAGSDLAFRRATDWGVVVGVEDVEAGTTLSTVYTVDVSPDASPGDTVDFAGIEGASDVRADMVVDAEFGTATAVVSTGTGGPVARADADGDGDIDTGELQDAIAGWARGEFTTDELARIVRAWASG